MKGAEILAQLRRDAGGAGMHVPGKGLVVLCPSEAIGRQISPHGAPIPAKPEHGKSDGIRMVIQLLGHGATITVTTEHIPDNLHIPEGIPIVLHPKCDPEQSEIRAALKTLEANRGGPLRVPNIWVCGSIEDYEAARAADVIPEEVSVFTKGPDFDRCVEERRDMKDIVVVDDGTLMVAAFATPSWSPMGVHLHQIGQVSDEMQLRVFDTAKDGVNIVKLNDDNPEP